jgi:hypothetical protein
MGMTDDLAKTDPEPSKPRLGSAGPRPSDSARPDGQADESFKQSMEELSRRLAERTARQKAVTPAAAAAARRAALQSYDRARARRLRLALGFFLGAVAGTGVACLIPMIGSQPVPSTAAETARIEAAPPAETASAVSTLAPIEPTPPPPAASMPTTPASPSAAELATADASGRTAHSQPAPVQPEAAAPKPSPSRAIVATASGAAAATIEAALRRGEVREVQMRLRSFGFNPGPADGIAGPMTFPAGRSARTEARRAHDHFVCRTLFQSVRAGAGRVRALRPLARLARALTTKSPRRRAFRAGRTD